MVAFHLASHSVAASCSGVIFQSARNGSGLRWDGEVTEVVERGGLDMVPGKAQTAHGEYGAINYSLSGPEHGEVVVCLHGLNGSRLLFHELSAALTAAQYRVLCFDLYGHGLSNAPPVDLCPCARLSLTERGGYACEAGHRQVQHHEDHQVALTAGHDRPRMVDDRCDGIDCGRLEGGIVMLGVADLRVLLRRRCPRHLQADLHARSFRN
ncbi:unnamed protein product [Prorocentrum cordatum]|uniref:AB hydrolase-1 domain-containing protein n=1 Tax=Prorocentrum cordatum TaxID=2364126 RepID=A0ABN9UHD2_9DINO|nr:unnamed protein product [Polarella glacialis]